jgi:hypothetical protein
VRPNRKWKNQDGGHQTGTTHISACVLDRNEIPTAITMFSGSSNSMELVGILSDKTGSGKSKMAAAKPELHISQPLDEIETKFQRLNLHLRGQATQ